MVFLLLLFFSESKIELQSYTACYGSIIKLSCPGNQKIVVDAVYVLAKHKSRGCSHGSADPSCCQYNARDCSVIYDSGSYKNYYEQCNGNSSCALPVSWINIPPRCNEIVDFKTTNYMKLDYFCIAGTGTLFFTLNGKIMKLIVFQENWICTNENYMYIFDILALKWYTWFDIDIWSNSSIRIIDLSK